MSNLQTGTTQAHIDDWAALTDERCGRCKRRPADHEGLCEDCLLDEEADTMPPPEAGDMAQLEETAGEVEP